MKSNAPWSVKGIERDARETAKAAAQREGMTVGEWLNQIIYTASDPNAPVSTGEIEGLKARDLAAAIEHLNRKIATAESRSADALENLARSLGGVVERLQRMERVRPADAPEAAGLASRIEALEAKSTDRTRIDALKALEKAVGQVAFQFNAAQQTSIARLDAVERRLAAIAERPDAIESVSPTAIREAFDAMTARIERAENIAREASELKADAQESVDPDFVQKTGIRLRILGDEIKRGGDQIRALEGTIGRLSQQIDGAEKRSAEGVQKVAETIADLRTQIAGADAVDHAAARAEIEEAVTEITRRTEDRISQLQRSFDELARRLDIQPAPPPAAAAVEHAEEPIALGAGPADQPLDLDAELDAAFAEIDDAGAPPVERKQPAAALKQRATPEISEPSDLADLDDFGFDLDESGFADAPEVTKPEYDAETGDVLAVIREAFGIDPPKPKSAETAAAEPDEETVEPTEAPPLADRDATTPAASPTPEADYLREARRAAREAAAKAAAEIEASGKRRQLTPKQRAILAAKLKRKKQEEAEKLAAAEAAPAPIAAPARDDQDEPKSVKDRVLAAVAKMKARMPAAAPKAAPEDREIAPDAATNASPKLLGAVSAAVAKLKSSPLSGGVAGLAFGIVLLLGALFVMTRNVLVRSDDQPASAPPAVVAQPAPVADAAAATDAPAAAADLVRPRALYLDNIAALISAQTDAEAKAALSRIEEAANLGHPPAQLQLGELYKIGQIYPKDLAEARVWFERAANGGNVLAMHRLGVMSARGEGGPVDARLSIEWFEKAAAFGLLDSQYNLGATYHPTPGAQAGGVQNAALAYFWYTVAAKNGDAQAGEMASQVGATLAPAEKAAKDAEAAAWAAKTPDPIANEVAAAG